MYNSERLAENIRSELKKRKLSQKELLEQCELGVNTITKLSNGTDILVKNLVKIADVLNCSTDYLLGRKSVLSTDLHNITNEDMALLGKIHSLPEDSLDEIMLLINHKYKQQQRKKKDASSNSEIKNNESYNMLA